MAEGTASAYARHRGVSPKAVDKAIREGRISDAVKRKGRSVIVDFVEADRLWKENTRPRRPNGAGLEDAKAATAGAGGANYHTARAVRETYEARLAKLEFERKSGALVPAEAVKLQWFNLVTQARNQLLGVPAKAKQHLPHLTREDVATISDLIREALEDLARADGSS